MTFEMWLEHINNLLNVTVDLSYRDLADYGYREAFEAGVSASTVVNELLSRGIFGV